MHNILIMDIKEKIRKIFTKKFLSDSWKILKTTFGSFSDDRGFKLSASLAYTTVFALGPLLLLIMSLASIFFGQDAIRGNVFAELNKLIGSSAAAQIQDIIKNIEFSGKTKFALISSIVVLLIGATGLFIEIQDSLNIIWRVKAKPKKGWVLFLKNRLLSSSLIISLGFLLIVSLIINGAVQALSHILERYLSDVTVILFYIINLVINFLVLVVLFGIIFKVLPDAKIKWKDVFVGALITSALFMLGKYGIGLYLGNSNLGSIYGAAGSIVILMIWVYYTAAILYLGAVYTKVYAGNFGGKIYPNDYSVWIKVEEVPVSKPVIKESTAINIPAEEDGDQ